MKRITVNLNRRAAFALDRLVEDDDLSQTDAVNRGLQVLYLLRHLAGDHPAGLLVRSATGHEHRLHLL